jgi:hypothetical protein
VNLTEFLGAAEKYIPQLMALEAGVTQSVPIPAETSPSFDLGPLGKFEVVTPALSVSVKKVG